MANIGKLLVVIGVVIIILGLVLWFGNNKFNWFGSLPGDISVEKKNYSFYAPITTMLILSGVISLVLWIIQKFMK